ncbi:S-adenosyl-L-methionine-dependent methyltransferase [Trichophaea hybrida]|nr:S-adenosyl-L-methionine-dependent methyltransferase [Trichophaea hybrida]
MHHEIMLLLLDGKLHLAPLENPQRILDIGTGTGMWAIDVADKYPTAKVVGTDLSPIQSKWVPPNCRFEIDDAEDDWTYRTDDYFDFIHARNISLGITDWPRLLSQAYRCLKPGANIELAEFGTEIECDDGTLGSTNAAKRNFELQTEAMTAMGRWPIKDQTLKDCLENAGFVDIQVTRIKQPIGPWSTDNSLKQIGSMVLLIAETGLRATCMEPFTTALGMSEKQASKSCREALKAMKNTNTHMYISFYVVHGRKPRGEKFK